ncbi:hypothetical protein BLNAU_22829 [Blattamonas nauphoetae]|uniref:Uncharacterized protein n=1 Tax=Blattamonas nauphoetae TaxID=2049346 RepID=A0ABQ9WRY5_9EUKA|nr:hypothetical protein BLNAU_22829 [Blattamonas nauphoetae]
MILCPILIFSLLFSTISPYDTNPHLSKLCQIQSHWQTDFSIKSNYTNVDDEKKEQEEKIPPKYLYTSTLGNDSKDCGVKLSPCRSISFTIQHHEDPDISLALYAERSDKIASFSLINAPPLYFYTEPQITLTNRTLVLKTLTADETKEDVIDDLEIPSISSFSHIARLTPSKTSTRLFSLVNSSLGCINLVLFHAPHSKVMSNELPYLSDRHFQQEGFFCLIQSNLLLGACIVTTATPPGFPTPLSHTATLPLVVAWRSGVHFASSRVTNITQNGTSLICVEGNGQTVLQKSLFEHVGLAPTPPQPKITVTRPSVLYAVADPTAQIGVLKTKFVDCAYSKTSPVLLFGANPLNVSSLQRPTNDEEQPPPPTHPSILFESSEMTITDPHAPSAALVACEYILMQFTNNTFTRAKPATTSFLFSSFSSNAEAFEEDAVCHQCNPSSNAAGGCNYAPAPIRLFHSFVDFTHSSISGLEGGFELVEGAAYFNNITMDISHAPSLPRAFPTSPSKSVSLASISDNLDPTPALVYTTQRPALHMNLNCSDKAKLHFSEEDTGEGWLEKGTDHLWFNLGDCEVVKGTFHRKFVPLYKTSLARASLKEGFTYAFSSSSSNTSPPPPLATETANSACFVTVDLFGEGLYPCSLQVNLSLIGKDRVVQSSRTLDLSALPSECYGAWHSSTHISLTFRRTELPSDTSGDKLKDRRYGVKIIYGPKQKDSSKSILVENELTDTTDEQTENDHDRAKRIAADRVRMEEEKGIVRTEQEKEAARKKSEEEEKKRETERKRKEEEERVRKEEEQKQEEIRKKEEEARKREEQKKEEQKQEETKKKTETEAEQTLETEKKKKKEEDERMERERREAKKKEEQRERERKEQESQQKEKEEEERRAREEAKQREEEKLREREEERKREEAERKRQEKIEKERQRREKEAEQPEVPPPRAPVPTVVVVLSVIIVVSVVVLVGLLVLLLVHRRRRKQRRDEQRLLTSIGSVLDDDSESDEADGQGPAGGWADETTDSYSPSGTLIHTLPKPESLLNDDEHLLG